MTGTDLVVIGGIAVTVLSLIMARVGIEVYSRNQSLYKIADVMVYGGCLVGGLTALFTIVMIAAYWI